VNYAMGQYAPMPALGVFGAKVQTSENGYPNPYSPSYAAQPNGGVNPYYGKGPAYDQRMADIARHRWPEDAQYDFLASVNAQPSVTKQPQSQSPYNIAHILPYLRNLIGI
jgi:hypothetical protein